MQKKAGKCATIFLPEIQKTSKKTLTNFKPIQNKSMKKKVWDHALGILFLRANKILLTMKLTLCIILFSFWGATATDLYSQNTKISLDYKNTSLKEVLGAIENQSEFFFLYSEKIIDVNRAVNIEAHGITIEKILDKIFVGTNVNYTLKGRQIVLTTPESNLFETHSNTQQQKSIIGKVTDTAGLGLPGVSVTVKGTTVGIITDTEGKYTLERVPTNATLVFSFVGMRTVEISAEGKNIININMQEDAIGIDEVIVTGYTSQKKADLTGSVSTVDVSKIRTGSTGNAMRAAQGKVAGMSVSASGSPAPTAQIRIRGEGTLNNNDPLYIIDGMPTTRSMQELATMDIESIQVLKDASSASIYGSRAANGVIIITTRKGSKGITIDFRSSYSMTSSAKPYSLMNTEQRGIAQYWAIRNDNPNTDPNVVGIGGLYKYQDHKDVNGNFVLDKVTWREYLDPGINTMRSSDTDWQKEVLRKGQIQQYNFTLSSGTDYGKAMFSLDYYDNKGTIKGSYFNRFSARINSDYKFLNNKVIVGENLTFSKWRNSLIGDGILRTTKQLMSIVPVHTVDGVGWGGPIGGMSDRQNAVRLIEDNKQNYIDQFRIFGNTFINVDLGKGLTFKSSYGVDFVGAWSRTMDLTYRSGFLSETKNKTTVNSNYTFNWNNSNILQYKNSINRHNFDFILGQETISNSYKWVWASRRIYALENSNYMQLSAGEEEKDNSGSESYNTMISWFSKFNYNYKDKYLASITVRRDASSVFGSNNRWAIFPAFSLGWSLKNEQFLKDQLEFFSQLKIRYGWGQNGNSRIDDYAYSQMYDALYDNGSAWDWNWGTAYDITGQGGNLPSGFRRTQRGNSNLKWETTSQHNFGLDFGIFNSKLFGSFDYYLKYTKDILMKPGSIATLGEGAGAWLNGANIDNKGYEFTLNYKEKFGEVSFSASGVFWHNSQTITNVPADVLSNFPGNGLEDNILGRPRASLYGYVTDGLFQSQSEVENHATQIGAAPGRIRYVDLNRDGIINSSDRTWIGVENPDLEFGTTLDLSYKHFDFSLFFNGLLGKDLNVQDWKSFTDIYALGSVGENYGTRMLNGWRPDNTDSTIPALALNNYNNEGRFSTYFVENGSYLKLRSAELGYSLPERFLKSTGIRAARASLRLDNILTVMKTWGKDQYTGLDPETPGNIYPLPFSTTLGLNITF